LNLSAITDVYLSHRLTSVLNFTHGNPFIGTIKRKRVAKYSDFKPVEGYISRTAQDTASGTIND